MRSTSVAITGASGYVGRVLTEHLKGKGFTILPLGRKAGDYPFQLGGDNDYSVLDKAGILIHCAYDFTARAWAEIERINVQGSIELLSKARKRGVSKIIFISSISTYEEAKSNYGKAKLAVEKEAHALGTVVVRPGIVFGKNAGGVIGTMSQFIRKHHIVPLIGNGMQVFYPCHDADLAQAIEKLIVAPVAPAHPITAAGKEPITYKNLMHTLAQCNSTKIMLIPIPSGLLYAVFTLAHTLGIKTKRGADSIVNLNTPNPTPDFRETDRLGLHFRPFSVATLAE